MDSIIDNTKLGFQLIVEQMRSAAHAKFDIINIIYYSLCVIIPVPAALIAYDHHYPIFSIASLYLIFLITIVLVLIIFGIVCIVFHYVDCGNWGLNWHLKKTSRYMEVCQLSNEYINILLPQVKAECSKELQFQLAGSSIDGFGFFPTLSSNHGLFPWSKPYVIQDVDLNVFCCNVILDNKYMQETVPGYCRICAEDRNIFHNIFLSNCFVKQHLFNSKYLLSGKCVSEEIGSMISSQVVYNYPALTYFTILKGPQGKYKFDVDIVFGIKVLKWPNIASEWPQRVYRNLPNKVIYEILEKGCYLVHKHCQENHDCHDFDWRITFAEAETILFKYHSKKEALKLCFVILKFAVKFSSQLKKKSYPALKSYYLKTLFLWIAEKNQLLTEFDMYNIESNHALDALFIYLLVEYKKVLNNGVLEHYFMPKVNILAQYTDKERQDGVLLIEEFLKKPLYVVSRFDTANMNTRAYQKTIVTCCLVAGACTWFSMYFNNLEKLFPDHSTTQQIFYVVVVFSMIGIINFWLQ